MSGGLNQTGPASQASHEVWGRLSFYPPHLRHAAHEHSTAHLSFVLAGGFAEQAGGEERDWHPGQGVRREAGARHAVRFGPFGALVLSFDKPWPQDLIPPSRALLPLPGARSAHVRAALDTVLGYDALFRGGPAAAASTPAWLEAARSQILSDPATATVQTLAGRCGVHRVQFSRAFTAHYGVRPSVLRLRSMVGHALTLALEEELSLAEGAAAAGFSDQAHLTRTVRAACGLPIGALRKLLRAQD